MIQALGRFAYGELHPLDSSVECIASRAIVRGDRGAAVLPDIATVVGGEDHRLRRGNGPLADLLQFLQHLIKSPAYFTPPPEPASSVCACGGSFSSRFPTLKCSGRCLGGNSVRVLSHCWTNAPAGTNMKRRSARHLAYRIEAMSAFSKGSLRRLKSFGSLNG